MNNFFVQTPGIRKLAKGKIECCGRHMDFETSRFIVLKKFFNETRVERDFQVQLEEKNSTYL